MLTFFRDEIGVILERYMPRGNTVTSATYAGLLKNHLRPAIKSKRRTVGYLDDLSGQKSIFEKSTEVEHKVT